MKSFLRVVACLFVLLSFHVDAIVNLNFHGNIDYLNDINNRLTPYNLNLGSNYEVSISLDSNPQINSEFPSPVLDNFYVYDIDASSIYNADIDFGNGSETFTQNLPGFGSISTYMVLANDHVWDQSTFLPNVVIPDGDVWLLQGLTSPGYLSAALMFIDSSGSAIDSTSNFIDPSIQSWSHQVLSLTDGDQTILVGVSEVPLPAGITLFLSGLVGLGVMRARNG